MYVRDLEAARGFFIEYFGATSNEQYHNPRTGLRTYFLSFEDSTRLEIMSRPGHESASLSDAAGWNHVAFSLGSQDAVDAMAKRLREGGSEILSGPRTVGDGYYECAFFDAEGETCHAMRKPAAGGVLVWI